MRTAVRGLVMRVFSVAVLLIATAFPLFAGETLTVEVPVSVVGSDGNPVRGLTKANFQLFDVVTLQLTPGKYAIKTLVRTPAVELNGYVRSDMTVPKSGETVLLSPFLLDDPQAWLL